jgi:chitinase
MKYLDYLIVFLLISTVGNAQKSKNLSVIAYYTGKDKQIDAYEVEKLTHIIFSFCSLKEGKLNVNSSKDSLSIQHLVSLKAGNPKLKVLLSLGGWGGCESCSTVFSTAEGRALFVKSVAEVNAYFKTDGIDLDWEYPTIAGYPGHLYQEADRANFTALVQGLRSALGPKNELSFAAGGFKTYLDLSVDWNAVMPLVDRVNIMSYDLVNGYSKVTGHHTPLFSVNKEEESTDRAVRYLLKLGIAAEKLVIGAAFYTRVWKEVSPIKNGLYQPGIPTEGVNFNSYEDKFTSEKGWKMYWDRKASANYWYNEKDRLFATGDSVLSVEKKTAYALRKGLGGIMFWELTLDTSKDGLLNAIYRVSGDGSEK